MENRSRCRSGSGGGRSTIFDSVGADRGGRNPLHYNGASTPPRSRAAARSVFHICILPWQYAQVWGPMSILPWQQRGSGRHRSIGVEQIGGGCRPPGAARSPPRAARSSLGAANVPPGHPDRHPEQPDRRSELTFCAQGRQSTIIVQRTATPGAPPRSAPLPSVHAAWMAEHT